MKQWIRKNYGAGFVLAALAAVFLVLLLTAPCAHGAPPICYICHHAPCVCIPVVDGGWWEQACGWSPLVRVLMGW